MMNKRLGLLSFGILALLLLVSFASAVITFSNVSTLVRNGTSATIDVTGNTTENITFLLTSITQDGKTITFNTPTSITNATGSPQTVTINYTIPTDFEFFFGKTYSTTLTANGTISGIATQTLSFEINNPNEFPDNGNLDIDIDDLSVEEGFGKDNEWFPLDEIEVKVDVRNDGNEKIRDIVVEWGLYNPNTGKWVIKEKESDFNLDNDEKKTLTINFKLDDVRDFDNGDTDYVFYAWATGEDEEFNDDKTSVSASEKIEMIIESDFVVLDNIQIPESAGCGDDVQITADVWNIGDESQDEVYVIIYNEKLGIDQKVVIGDIDEFDNEKLDTLVKIPQDTEEKSYTIELTVYDEDNNIYENDDDDKAEFITSFKVEGACVYEPKLIIISSLESGGKAGEELVVKASVINIDSSTRTFDVSATGYDTWAELVNINPETLTLSAGESKEVLFTLLVNRDVSGSKEFNMQLTTDEKVISQPFSVLVEKAGFSLITGKITGKALGENWYLWGIGALNIILVLIIIMVAVRLVRKK